MRFFRSFRTLAVLLYLLALTVLLVAAYAVSLGIVDTPLVRKAAVIGGLAFVAALVSSTVGTGK